MKFILFCAVLFTAQVSLAQTTVNVIVKDETTKDIIAGANVAVKDTAISATTDKRGVAQLSNIPDGPQTLVIFFPGYETKELNLSAGQTEVLVFMKVNNE